MRLVRFIAATVFLLVASAAACETFSVGPELWDRPRSGRILLEQPAVRRAVNAYLANPVQTLVIHHALGADAAGQGEELRNWLIALAIEPARIVLAGDLAAGEVLKIEVIAKR